MTAVDTGPNYADAFDKWESQMADESIFPNGTTGEGQKQRFTDEAVEELLMRNPNTQALRLECLRQAALFDPEAGEGEVMARAKKFADFVIEGKMPEYPSPEEGEDDTELAQVRRRGYGTLAYDEEGNEVE